ncbi:hypothetical protein NC652_021258 [Populus alba x Populus x berolinensis]|nr:hypothetical protein NC652_021258 [Populus alba x Populus x berolinensis]
MASFSSSPCDSQTQILVSLFLNVVVKSRCLEEQQSTAAALSITAASLNDDDNQHSSTKLLTFLGKGGSGKTTSVFAAQVLLSMNSCYPT